MNVNAAHSAIIGFEWFSVCGFGLAWLGLVWLWNGWAVGAREMHVVVSIHIKLYV